MDISTHTANLLISHKESIFTIHQFCMCLFIYLLKFIFNAQVNTHSAFTVIHRCVQSGTKYQGDSAFLFQFSNCNHMLSTIYLAHISCVSMLFDGDVAV